MFVDELFDAGKVRVFFCEVDVEYLNGLLVKIVVVEIVVGFEYLIDSFSIDLYILDFFKFAAKFFQKQAISTEFHEFELLAFSGW